MICSVRAAYEGLIRQLERSFEVNVLDSFDFVLQDEPDEDDDFSRRFPIRRVVAWSLQDAGELEERRVREASAEQERRDLEELADLQARYGFTMEFFVDALRSASSKKPSGPTPSSEGINRSTAKSLRTAGYSVTAGDVRRIRQLLERYNPDAR